MHRRSLRSFAYRFLYAVVALMVLLAAGTAGLRMLGGLSLFDALYLTVITVSTVGFGEIQPLNSNARLFVIGIIAASAIITIYTVATATELVTSDEWHRNWHARRERKMLQELKNHVIVCGYGRVGSNVVRQLEAQGIPFIVIDPDAVKIAALKEQGYLALEGKGSEDKLLQQAGIERARGLIAAVSSDAQNVFIVLTARGIAPNLLIIARASDEDSEPKLVRAGANRVFSPYRITGHQMVAMMIYPDLPLPNP
jgi:voltage-gated potassium channel